MLETEGILPPGPSRFIFPAMLFSHSGRILPALLLLAASGTGTGGLRAQSLPPYAAVNPVVASRSGLMTQPYLDPTSRWRFSVLLDYANSAELNQRADGRTYVLDGEYLRADLTLSRDVTRNVFVMASLGLEGAYDGFLDPFLNWYHDFIRLPVPARSEDRPENKFAYRIQLPDGVVIDRQRDGAFIGDLRVGAGWRLNRHLQAVATLTLPTSTGADGFGRGVVSTNVVTTARFPFARRWTWESTAGLGYTPRHEAELKPFQNTTFGSASSGLRWRFSGQQAVFANVIYLSPQYHGTGFQSLDQREVTIDFGGLFRIGNGPEWQVGITEDLDPAGPALDLSFRVGVRY